MHKKVIYQAIARLIDLMARRKRLMHVTMNVLVSIALTIVMLYVGKHANLPASINSDGLVNTFLFKSFRLHDMIVPSNHTAVLKWPLLFIQSLFTYNFTSYSLLNMFLLFSTIWGWCTGLTILFGKKYYLLICITMIILLIGSTSFPFALTFATFRNIEYPIGLFFVISLRRIVYPKKIGRMLWVVLIVSLLLFSLAIAGDSLMLVTFIIPLFIIGILYWLKGGRLTQKNLKVLAIVTSTVLVAFVIKWFVVKSGLAIMYYDKSLDPFIANYDTLWPSIPFAFNQLFNLVGADITSKAVSFNNSFYFLKFSVSALSILGLVGVLVRLIKSKSKDMLKPDTIEYTFMALSFISTMAAYVMLGFVLTKLPNGQLVDSGASRYLAVLPLLMVSGIIVGYKFLPANRKNAVLLIYIVVSCVFVVLSINQIGTAIASQDAAEMTIIKQQKIIAEALKNNGVQFFASGYWDGATTRFWSNDTLQYVSINSCNQTAPNFNTRISWLKDGTYNKTALLIDRNGLSASYWHCTNDQLLKIYGQPSKIIYASDNGDNGPILWIYDYDIRSNIISDYSTLVQ